MKKDYCTHLPDCVEAVPVEGLQQRPGAVKYPHDPLPHQTGLAGISHDHILYGLTLVSKQSVYNQSGDCG